MAYDKTLAINLGRLDTYDILIKDYIEDKLSISHHNLLINADFRQTVNRNGRTSYTGGNGYHKSIDMWSLCNGTLTVGEDVLSLTSDDEKDCFIDQRIKLDASVKDKTFTFTGLLSDTTNGYGCARVVIIGATGDESIADFVGDYVISGTTSVTVNLADYPDAVYLACRIMNNFPNTTVDIVACKLEFGEEQTLVDIDGDGNITIREVTDYDEEYLKSSLYSHNTRKFIGMNHSNANILDNWYFKNPVNRQNLTSKIVGENWSYPMDRWFATRAKLDLTPDGLSLNVMDNPSMDFCSIMQRVKYNYFDTQYTVSAIIDGVLYSETLTSPSSSNQTDYSNSAYKDGIAFGLQRLDSGLMNVYVYIRTTTPKVISAVKCELGAVQTLAKQNDDGEWILNDPPANYEIEYVKCIQYDINTGDYIGLNANTVNALSTEGGIVNGDITIAKDTTPILALKNTANSIEAQVAAVDNGAQLVTGAINDENNKATLTLNRETSNLNNAVQLERIINGKSTVYNIYGEHNKPTHTDVGAEPANSVSNHNVAQNAHNDIRELITSLTTSKVSVSAIINNLTSTNTDKPLSAAQGKALKDTISNLTAASVGAAPAYTYGTTDLTAGSSELATGKLYFVYE